MNIARVMSVGVAALLALSIARSAGAEPQAAPQEASGPAAGAVRVPGGPPVPVPPAVIARDDAGNVTVRAVRVTQPPRIDGRLDEEIYRTTQASDGFIQQEPHEGEPATEKTDAWVLFDDENIYISARCWDDEPERWAVNELRRDSNNITQNENFSVVFDTFLDKRNGFFFPDDPAWRHARSDLHQ